MSTISGEISNITLKISVQISKILRQISKISVEISKILVDIYKMFVKSRGYGRNLKDLKDFVLNFDDFDQKLEDFRHILNKVKISYCCPIL